MKLRCKSCRHEFLSDEIADFDGHCPSCGAAMAGDFSGGCIDEFQVLAELGRGNNGAVFLARQYGVNREVALKIMLEDSLKEADGVAKFFSEARAVAKLNHPNIVQAIAAGKMESGNFYFAMELVEGPSVENLLDASGALPFSDALEIGEAIAQAMAYGWDKRGLIHGDIKPGNIILQHGKTPKLADLGLAQFHKVVPGDIMATPLYAPPEVIRGDFAHMSYYSDIYSFGATLYEMFSGDPPFPGNDIDLVLKMQLEQTPEPLVAKLGLFQPELSEFIDRMLAKDPSGRPGSWDEVADFLSAVYEKHKGSH